MCILFTSEAVTIEICYQDFIAMADEKYKKLKDDYELLEQKFDELATFYCFDKKKTTLEEFFGDITTFVKDFEVGALGGGGGCWGWSSRSGTWDLTVLMFVFQRAQKENEKMREQLEKQRQQKEKEVGKRNRE